MSDCPNCDELRKRLHERQHEVDRLRATLARSEKHGAVQAAVDERERCHAIRRQQNDWKRLAKRLRFQLSAHLSEHHAPTWGHDVDEFYEDTQ